MAVTKAQITKGSQVRYTGSTRTGITGDVVVQHGETVEVSDLMDRKNYDKPDRIGVRRPGSRVTVGVALTDVEAAA